MLVLKQNLSAVEQHKYIQCVTNRDMVLLKNLIEKFCLQLWGKVSKQLVSNIQFCRNQTVCNAWTRCILFFQLPTALNIKSELFDYDLFKILKNQSAMSEKGNIVVSLCLLVSFITIWLVEDSTATKGESDKVLKSNNL